MGPPATPRDEVNIQSYKTGLHDLIATAANEVRNCAITDVATPTEVIDAIADALDSTLEALLLRSGLMTNKKFVVVTTTTDAIKRGVFGGYLESKEGDSVVLSHARNCWHWPKECRGVLGLAVIGPPQGSLVGPAVSRMELSGVKSISHASETAIQRWESEPWFNTG